MPKHDTLLQRVRACQLCQQLPLGPNPILQCHPDAKILIAGQAPGRITHHKNRPFDDPSGERLRNWLGVDQATFYDETKFAIIPMAFCFPGTYSKAQGKNGDRPPPAICADTWRQPILDTLPNLELTLVIGRYAMDWHLKPEKKMTLTQIVQQWADYLPSQLPLPHPSPRNNRWLKNNPWFESEVLPTLQASISRIL
ncbi:uracil-DNA glycosylase family protein [Kangiella sp. TOML190]|uniref:uracil-DNA glycosylase family protein n=1 Tax=Kangiella sp. TOML190 TaxID=2931351 RepID=UPI00203B97C3|nr:uracil-DNA glycosylase family protein [Kangiella sp. TOML190]